MILPILIVVMVLGSIFGGFATPTEAAAIGVFGAMLASAVEPAADVGDASRPRRCRRCV